MDTDLLMTVAEAIDPEVWAEELPVPTAGGIARWHERRQESTATAGRVVRRLQEAGHLPESIGEEIIPAVAP